MTRRTVTTEARVGTSRGRLAGRSKAMELVIFFGAWVLLVIGAVVGGADSRPGINQSRDWGLHTWHRRD